LALWTGGGKKAAPTWGQAIIEHYWSGDQPVGNLVDMATIGLGISIGCNWLLVTFAMTTAQNAFLNLHRPTGIVTYDDTDHDVWSEYHHDVKNTELLIADVINRMVLRGSVSAPFVACFWLYLYLI
jgi:hypothetical protein